MAPQGKGATFILVDIFYVTKDLAVTLLEERREGYDGCLG